MSFGKEPHDLQWFTESTPVLTDPALRLYQNKAISKFLYGTEIWDWNYVLINNLKTFQNLFLKS